MSWTTLILLGLLVILTVGCGSDAAQNADVTNAGLGETDGGSDSEETFVIGALDSLTGLGESYGVPLSQTKLLAVEEINAAGGVNGRLLRLVVEDSKCTANDAITAYRRLTDVEGVKIILGSTCSSGTLGVAPLAEKDGVILLSPSSTSPDITLAGDYVFRTAINSLQTGTDVGNTVYAHGMRRIGTITEAPIMRRAFAARPSASSKNLAVQSWRQRVTLRR